MYADQPVNQTNQIKPLPPKNSRAQFFRNIPKLKTHSATANPQNAMRNATSSQWLGDGLDEAAFERLGPLVDVGIPTLGAVDGDDGDGDGDGEVVLVLRTWGFGRC